MHTLKKVLPDRQDLLYAYGGIVFVIYSWALRGFFYWLPSFLLYHSIGDILAILSYDMALALLETIAVLGVLVLLAVILPARWFRIGFSYKAFLTLLVAAFGAIVLERYLTKKMDLVGWLYGGFVIAVVLVVALILFFEYVPRLRALLVSGLERLQIFTYIYVPIGVLGLLVVFIRLLR